MADRKYGVPAIISLLVPGLGQIIKGEILKGLGIMLALFISGVLTWVLIGFITTPVIFFWQVYDAYNAQP
ncbi:hypothetical protein ACK3SF_05100 [Candidatus Nanosalina sp. VS9-1]|uniref:hypothetical protein n=1 Tax=Candidatus Nanosalina sp. VS9-1 TaxID=3388566 RepID=UPI0039E0D71B